MKSSGKRAKTAPVPQSQMFRDLVTMFPSLAEPGAPYQDEPQAGAIGGADLVLVELIARASCGPGAVPLGILIEVLKLSPRVRRQLADIIPDVQRRSLPPAVWHRRCAELYEVLERARRPRMLADAWVMSPEQWRAEHDPA